MPSYLEEAPEEEIGCFRIEPRAAKFAEALSHRDFLGALMGLGIKREMLGDLAVTENCAQLAALSTVREVLLRELTEVKHTKVRVSEIARDELSAVRRTEIRSINAASLRADVLIAAVWRLSRTQAKESFARGEVFRNGIEMENPSAELKAEDFVSLRGKGKFKLCGTDARVTKSGRLYIDIAYYI